MKNKQTGAEDRMNQNEKKEMKIRIAKEEDAEALLAIYAPYIEHTVITYGMMCRPWKNSEEESDTCWRDIHILWQS